MSLVLTPQMKKRITPRVQRMIEVSLRRFPELEKRKIKVGYTRANLGTAIIPLGPESEVDMGIRLNIRNLTYNTIGHELTHLVQGLSQEPKNTRSNRKRLLLGKMPGGETQCDIWTLARSELFCDEPPIYLKLPRAVKGDWPRYAGSVRALCIAAILKRETHRHYIRWLENQIKQLPHRGKVRRSPSAEQLNLPFIS